MTIVTKNDPVGLNATWAKVPVLDYETGDLSMAESVLAENAPLQSRQRITVMTTLPNGEATGRIPSTKSEHGYPIWLQGLHWYRGVGDGLSLEQLACAACGETDEETIDEQEHSDIEQISFDCRTDQAYAYRMAAAGFDAKCASRDLVDFMPRNRIERQTSLALATLLAWQTVAAVNGTGYEDDGVTPTGQPLGDRSGDTEVCVHKGLAVLESARETNGDGTLGVLVITSALKYYMVKEGYVVRVGNHYETPDGDRVVFVPAAALTEPAGAVEGGLWIYSINAADWALTDVEDLGEDGTKTKEQALGNRHPVPHAGRYGIVRVDSHEAYGVRVTAGCEGGEGEVS